jgi:hypothetical protein
MTSSTTIDNIFTAFSNKKSKRGIYGDLKQAFYSVDHNVLLDKL